MFIQRQQLLTWILLIALVMRVASDDTANLSYLVIGAYALLGRSQVIQALVLSCLFTMINPGISPDVSATSIGRYLVIGCAVLSVFMRSKVLREGRIVGVLSLQTFLLGLFLVAHSFLFSSVVDVSVLKAFSWTVTMTTLVAAWSGLRMRQRESLSRQIFGGLILLMFVSLPFIFLQVGYLRNGTGFQGVLNHSQAFGLTMALLGAWAASRIAGEKVPPWSMVMIAVACLVLVVMSEARTAGLALVLGVGCALIAASWLAGRPARLVLPGLYNKRIYILGIIVLLGGVLTGPTLVNKIDGYLSKRVDAMSLAEAYEVSRGKLIFTMVDNIQTKPFLGIGFGVASDLSLMEISREPVLGIPVGTAIEKGVLPLAVLEEVGVVGFGAIMAWVWVLLRRSSSLGVSNLAVTMTALLLNMGEYTLFSPGGMGLLSLVLIAWASSSDASAQR